MIVVRSGVMVIGHIVVQGGKLLSIDEEATAERLVQVASRPRTEKEKVLVQAMDEVKHHVIRYYEGWHQKVRPEPHFTANSRRDGKIQ